jgi:hypothetical protein
MFQAAKLITLMICFLQIMEIFCSDKSDELENAAIYSYIRQHPYILKAVLSKIDHYDEELASFNDLRNDKRGARLPIDGYIMGKRSE